MSSPLMNFDTFLPPRGRAPGVRATLWLGLCVVLAAGSAGCGIFGTGPVADLRSSDPAERMTGMKVAADRGQPRRICR